MVTVEKLIANARRLREAKELPPTPIKIKILELDDIFTFKKVTTAMFKEVLEDENLTDEEKDMAIIYNSCIEPKLNDDRLIKTLGCNSNPTDVVGKILSESAIAQVSFMLLEQSGIGKKEKAVELIEDIKNL